MGVAMAVEAAKATAMIKGLGSTSSLRARMTANGVARAAAGLFRINRLRPAVRK